MSYTIVGEPHPYVGADMKMREATILHIRAVISTRVELHELIEKLNRRLETDFAQEEQTNDRSSSEQPAAVSAELPADDGFIRSFRGD